jgi:FkbM family methyltransferase
MFVWMRKPSAAVETVTSLKTEPVSPPEIVEGSLLGGQLSVMGRESALTIVDAGAQHGQTARQYLEAFPNCRVIALEPESTNHVAAVAALAPYGERVELIRAGLSNIDGEADLYLTSHSGAHSLLEVGDMRYYDEPVEVLAPERVKILALDRLCTERGVETLDILKMDIQGSELLALKGANGLLTRGAVRLIAMEVLFQPLYRDQPSFWDLADHLRGYGYALQGIYEQQLHRNNAAVLRWADAIFVSPHMCKLT